MAEHGGGECIEPYKHIIFMYECYGHCIAKISGVHLCKSGKYDGVYFFQYTSSFQSTRLDTRQQNSRVLSILPELVTELNFFLV